MVPDAMQLDRGIDSKIPSPKANDPVDMAKKILEFLQDPERRARMGAFGRKRVSDELAWSHEAPKLLAAYETLFNVKS